MNRDVVVTGVGAVTPLGVGARTLHERWRAGASGIEDGEGRCTEFDPTEHLSSKEARRADRFTQLALVASDEALRRGRLGRTSCPTTPSASAASSAPASAASARSSTARRRCSRRAPNAVSPLAVPLMMGNAAAGAVAMRHGLRGQSYAIRVAPAPRARTRSAPRPG